MTLEIAVLVSVGRHPASGRARRARTDARALELGLQLAESHGAKLHALHAGDAGIPALRDYLGMGIGTLHVLACPANADPVPALAERLRALGPALVLTGTQAEAGWSSGCLPYAIAAALGYAIAPGVTQLDLDGVSADVHQALPQGRRRALRVTLPAVLTVDRAAPPPRQSAYARARRGSIVVERPAAQRMPSPEPALVRPARARPPRPRVARHASGAERLKALTTGPARATRVIHPASASEAARSIHELLVARSLIGGGR